MWRELILNYVILIIIIFLISKFLFPSVIYNLTIDNSNVCDSIQTKIESPIAALNFVNCKGCAVFYDNFVFTWLSIGET